MFSYTTLTLTWNLKHCLPETRGCLVILSQTLTARTVVTKLPGWASVSLSVNQTGSMRYEHPCSSKMNFCLSLKLLHFLTMPRNSWGRISGREWRGHGDGSVGKGACHPAWCCEFNPQDPRCQRREPTPSSCSLTSTHVLQYIFPHYNNK